jgi:hypothetical protein
MGRHPRSAVLPGETPRPGLAHSVKGRALSRFACDAYPRNALRELHNLALYRTPVGVARSGSAIVS